MEIATMIRIAMFGLIALGATMTAQAGEEAVEASRLAKATLEAAKEGLRNERANFGVPDLFWGSQRILWAELELAATPRARLDAFQSHANRSNEFERKVVKLKRRSALSNTRSLYHH